MSVDPLQGLPGQRLGKYVIQSEIGRGGMGVVFRGYDPALQRTVAIKVLPPRLGYDEEFVERFHREAVLAANLHHPNIVTIHDVGEQEMPNGLTLHYIVMEFVEGVTLEHWLRQSGPMSAQQVNQIVEQVSAALTYAQDSGVVHRDVKPANIMLSTAPNSTVIHAKLMDFGLVRASEGTSAAGGPGLTRSGVVVGTPEYMSPEQALGQPVDARSDIYALGVVIYRMLAGGVPFSRSTPYAITYAHINEPPPPLRAARPDLPPMVERVVMKALAKSPADRYERAADLANDFAAAAGGLSGAPLGAYAVVARETTPARGQKTPPASPPPPAGPRPATPSPRQPQGRSVMPVLVVVTALLLVTVVALVWILTKTKLVPGSRTAAQGAMVTEVANAVLANATEPPVVVILLTETPAGPAPTEPLPTASTKEATEAPAQQAPTLTSAPSPVPPTATPLPPTESPATEPPPTEVPTEPPPTATLPPPTATEPARATVAPKPTAIPPATAGPVITNTDSRTVLDFESFGTWKRGNEPYGTFTQSVEQIHDGRFSAKLAYDIPPVEKHYVVFLRQSPAAIPGRPSALTLWVFGDGSGHFMNAWVQDSQGEVRQFTFGRINHTGWAPMSAVLDPAAPWPQGHISGTDNGALDYPVKLQGFVLDAVASERATGAVYLDSLQIGEDETQGNSGPAAAAQPTAAPVGEATQAPQPASAAAGQLSGHIVYADGGNTITVVDVATGNQWPIAGGARQPDIHGDGLVVANGIGGGRNDLFVVTLQGQERIIGKHPEDSYPSWNPGGDGITFHSALQGDGKDRIYIEWSTAARAEPTRLRIGETDAFGRFPTWLSNGRIAYSGCDYWAGGRSCGLWTVGPDGSSPIKLTDQMNDISSDGWGDQMLFSSQDTGDWDIYVMPAGGGSRRNLTNSPSQEAGATFSPDGQHIAFISDRNGWGIWIISVSGGGATKLIAVPKGFGGDWPAERLAWGP